MKALGSLCERFVFVGGCATGLLLTVDAGPPVRATRDVDVIVEVLSLVEYHDLERQLERAGCLLTFPATGPARHVYR